MNQRFRDVLLRNGLTVADVAERVGVDPKTVERWMTRGRTPYPKHRHAVALLLRESESYLWPDAMTVAAEVDLAESEVIRVYPHRNSVPGGLWRGLLERSSENVHILTYVGAFLTEDPDFVPTLRRKAAKGVEVRLLLGDPDRPEIRRRSLDEGIGRGTISAKIRNALMFYRQLSDVSGVDIRLHGTTLYNSIYRYDHEMVVNPHVYGIPAPHAPAMHLRHLSAGTMFETYQRSLDRVWDAANPVAW